MKALDGSPTTRSAGGEAYKTDNGNIIVDTTFSPLNDALTVDRSIRSIPGVVDTGLFLSMASRVIVGRNDGVTVMDAPGAR